MLKKKRFLRIFLPVFFITFGVMLLAFIIGAFWLRSYVAPPTVPSVADIAPPFTDENNSNNFTNQDNSNETIDESDPAFIIPQPHPEDAQLGETPSQSNTTQLERRPNFYTFLLIGLDEGINADTIMVAAFDAATQQAYLLSIPRDTRVDVQRNLRKIVVAYPAGWIHGGGHSGGINQLKREVQTLIGFRPDFYVSVNFDAFINLVDAVNGVEVYVPFHMLYTDPYDDLHIDIPAGLQILDGENALHFARYRLGNDRRYSITDYRRMEHQQQILTSLLSDLMSPRSILLIPHLINSYHTNVRSSLSLGEKLWFGEQFARSSGITLETHTLPTTGTSGPPNWYEFPDKNRILELINRTINPFTTDITADMLRIAQ